MTAELRPLHCPSNGVKVKVNHANGMTYYMLRCPACDEVHMINATWTFNGDVKHPTFNPSILARWSVMDDDGNSMKDMVCHSFIRDGKIQFLNDCTHALVGKTVDLPDWEAEVAG